jgi:hypothetical protein
MLKIDEVFGCRNKPTGEEFAEMKGDDGILFEKGQRIVHYMKAGWVHSPDGGGMGNIQQDRNISKNVTGLAARRNRLPIFDNLHPPLDQDKKIARRAALFKNAFSSGYFPNRVAAECLEERFVERCHVSSIERQRSCLEKNFQSSSIIGSSREQPVRDPT